MTDDANAPPMATNTWTSPWLPGARVDLALAILDGAGYQRLQSSGGAGSYVCDEEPMYRDGGYIKSLVVSEDPERPVIARLESLLARDQPTSP
jgi:hypothetical protein